MNALATDRMVKLALTIMTSKKPGIKRVALKNRKFEEVPDEDVDVEVDSPTKFFGTHINLLPLQNAVSGSRAFYAARFQNQALPLVHAEAPLVQTLADEDSKGVGRSFDDVLGRYAGAVRTDTGGTVNSVSDNGIDLVGDDGERKKIALYNRFPLNRKTSIHNTALVKPGDHVIPGQLLAKSNYTDNNGTLAMGINARVGVVPYLGRSMDDAIVLSDSMAKRLTSNQLYGHDLDYKRGVKGGKGHYMGMFPHKFTTKQLEKLDTEGVAQPGAILEPGDPIILATRPRVVTSTSAQLGLLSKHMKHARMDGAVLWDKDTPGKVVDVEKLRSGVKVNVETDMPAKEGDKLAFRSGQKAVISHIIPDEQMPRTVDGQPLEVLLNPLGIPSRINNSLIYELLLGKAAQKLGKPYKLAGFNKPNEKWHEMVAAELQKAGVTDTEDVFDPMLNKKLENPITVGIGHVLKLHHTAESKISSRGQGSYDIDEQPTHGSGEAAQSKRLSLLEVHGLMSSGAYNFLREASTLRGQKNDEYWKRLRMGYDPKPPGSPFIWTKFRTLLSGAGYQNKDLRDGKIRLQFWTDRDLDRLNPLEVRTGDIVDLGTMTPVKGGLFDDSLTGSGSWGYVQLPGPFPQPAAEDTIRKLLGLTEKQFRSIMAGEAELPENLR